METKLSWEEAKKIIEKVLEPMKEEEIKFISELNGKYMDYKSCRMIEKLIEAEREMWFEVCKKIVGKIK